MIKIEPFRDSGGQRRPFSLGWDYGCLWWSAPKFGRAARKCDCVTWTHYDRGAGRLESFYEVTLPLIGTLLIRIERENDCPVPASGYWIPGKKRGACMTFTTKAYFISAAFFALLIIIPLVRVRRLRANIRHLVFQKHFVKPVFSAFGWRVHLTLTSDAWQGGRCVSLTLWEVATHQGRRQLCGPKSTCALRYNRPEKPFRADLAREPTVFFEWRKRRRA